MTADRARILVVDDSRTALLLLERMLHHGGYQDVTTTSDSTEVMTLVERLRPDVLLTDLTMPPPGGLELIAAVRRLAADERPAVLVLSGDTWPGTEEKVLAAGARGVLVKPFDVSELLARCRLSSKRSACSVRSCRRGLCLGRDRGRLGGSRRAGSQCRAASRRRLGV